MLPANAGGIANITVFLAINQLCNNFSEDTGASSKTVQKHFIIPLQYINESVSLFFGGNRLNHCVVYLARRCSLCVS